MKKILNRSFDTKDRLKISQRTQKYTGDYNYRLAIDQSAVGDSFSFMVLGDSGTGNKKKRAKFLVPSAMKEVHDDQSDFILHLGDLVYLSGSKEGYKHRFIHPYQHWLLHGIKHKYHNMVFNKAFLPVMGNHDYYDFKNIRILGKLASLFGAREIGSGSENGKVFETAFVNTSDARVTEGVLPYIPNVQTKIPNRYYWFTYSNCAFIALDSNTLDCVPNPSNSASEDLKEQRRLAKKAVKACKRQLELYYRKLASNIPAEDKRSIKTAISLLIDQLAEEEKKLVSIKKFLKANKQDHDNDQLNWLKMVLSLPEVRDKWKVVYMHHPLYSSNESHTDDLESVGLRKNLREIFASHGVHIVLSGHSHCFEWISNNVDYDTETAKKESNICYLTSGGGGRDLHNSILDENLEYQLNTRKKQMQFLDVARSRAYGAFAEIGEKAKLTKMYHYLNIEVKPDLIKVVPVGVIEDELQPDGWSTILPMPVKQFNYHGSSIDIDKSSKLKYIKISRDKPPEAVWE